MYLAFLDECGHIGPFISRSDPSYNQSPIFGLAGYIIPHHEARAFATFFFQLKGWMLAREIRQLSVHPATWEKKGTDLFKDKNIRRYPRLKDGIHRIVNRLYQVDGKFFFCAREKYQSPTHSKATGLYTTVLSQAIRQSDKYVTRRRSQFMMILDQHTDRIRLLETSAKTMFGAEPARTLIEPPFHVESHLYQTIQAADWIATIVGKALTHRIKPAEFPELQWAEDVFSGQIERFSTDSIFWRPPSAKSRGLLSAGDAEIIIPPQASLNL